jgi:uncharacterized membrane protein
MSILNSFGNRLPSLRSRWWALVLGLSLMINLGIGGAIIGHLVNKRQMEHMVRDGFVQLVPRKFFDDLPEPRRKELMRFLRDSRHEFKAMRDASQITALQLADALDNYDPAKVKAVIDSFATGGESMAARSGTVVMEMIAKLSPEERKQLAIAIRDRDNHEQK